MACIIALVMGAAAIAWRSETDLATRVGEQRIVTLEDGSRVALNTDSRIVVEPWRDKREIRLERGEAYFEVSKDRDRPFVVAAGNKQVVAIGTAFVVRRDPREGDEKISVTLIEGKVAVIDRSMEPRAAMIEQTRVPTLIAGQRMTLSRSMPPAVEIDRPRIDAVTAWRRGEVVMDNTALKEAASELNRYSSIALVIEDDAANLPVSGIFRTGDSESFATAVASLYGLSITREPERLVLSASPSVH